MGQKKRYTPQIAVENNQKKKIWKKTHNKGYLYGDNSKGRIKYFKSTLFQLVSGNILGKNTLFSKYDFSASNNGQSSNGF